MPAVRRASELKAGDILLGRRPGPLAVVTQPFETQYRGLYPGWRIPVGDGYPAVVVAGDPEMYIAEDPNAAWDEHVLVEHMKKKRKTR